MCRSVSPSPWVLRWRRRVKTDCGFVADDWMAPRNRSAHSHNQCRTREQLAMIAMMMYQWRVNRFARHASRRRERRITPETHMGISEIINRFISKHSPHIRPDAPHSESTIRILNREHTKINIERWNEGRQQQQKTPAAQSSRTFSKFKFRTIKNGNWWKQIAIIFSLFYS